jgi:hypothetical protein
MAQSVGSHALGDPGLAGDALDDPCGGVAIEAFVVSSEEQRAFAAFANREVDRSGGAGRKRDDHRLAAFAQDGQGAMPRSRPSASMLAPVASETRSPSSASKLINA